MTLRIAITGGSGFIGTNLIQYYMDKAVELVNIDMERPRNDVQTRYWHKADILKLDTLKSIIRDFSPTHLIHLAARTDLYEKHDITGYAVNIKGVENIIEAINSYGEIKRTIFTSSRAVCRKGYVPKDHNDYTPIASLYGRSKVLGEEIVKNSNILSEWVIVRPASIWGPWFGEPYKNFFDIIIKRRYLHPGTCSCTKTFGYVKNTVYQIDKLLFFDGPGIDHKVFYIGDYEPIDVAKWADQIAGMLGRGPIKHAPFFLFKVAAIVGDILQHGGFKGFPMNSYRLDNITVDNPLDLSETARIVPSLPYSLESGIKETLEWLRR